jgi:NADH-quinone oxidoreductase subunit L
MMVMTFWGPERFRESNLAHHDEHAEDKEHAQHAIHEPRESPWSMTVPLVVLAILSTFGGLIGVSYAVGSLVSSHPVNYIEEILNPAISEVPRGSHVSEANHGTTQSTEGFPKAVEAVPAPEHAHSPEEISAERWLALLSIAIAASGIAMGWLIFQRRPLLAMPQLLENKYYVDEIYDATLINPITVGSREGLWKLFDVGVIDGFLHSLGDVIKEGGRVVRQLQAGFVRGYAAIILVGALVVIGFFAYFGIQALGFVR